MGLLKNINKGHVILTKENMNPITVGKYTLTSGFIKSFLFMLFLVGVVMGALIAQAEDSGHSFSYAFFILGIIPIWIILSPKMKQGIKKED